MNITKGRLKLYLDTTIPNYVYAMDAPECMGEVPYAPPSVSPPAN
jgi:hypothetical protein